MTGADHLDQALALITAATDGGGVDRTAAIRWYELLQQATGDDAEKIGMMGEALLVSAQGDDEQAWVQALLNGGPKAAMLEQQRQERRMAAIRTDAESSGQANDDDQIDWATVAAEAAAMVGLNKESVSSWKGQKRPEMEE